MNRLPPEVIRTIASHSDPWDCIEWFKVSRQCRHVLYAAQPWRDITVDENSLRMLSYIPVLGRFVRTARIRFKQYGSVTKVMHHLKACSSLERLGR